MTVGGEGFASRAHVDHPRFGDEAEDHMESDELYARRLQALEEQEYASRMNNGNTGEARSSQRPAFSYEENGGATATQTRPSDDANEQLGSVEDEAGINSLDPVVREQLRIEQQIRLRNQQRNQLPSSPSSPPPPTPPPPTHPTSSGSPPARRPPVPNVSVPSRRAMPPQKKPSRVAPSSSTPGSEAQGGSASSLGRGAHHIVGTDEVLLPTDDVAVARKEQLMEDERMARQLQAQERMTGAPLEGARVARTGGGRSFCVRCTHSILLVVLVSAAVILVLSYLSGGAWTGGTGEDLPPFFSDSWGDNGDADGFSRWYTDGNGLHLIVTNALTDNWWAYLNRATNSWDDGNPDALDLTVETLNLPEPGCVPARGRLKVCNDDYGITGWTGLNEVYFDAGYVVSSVAKMNEYYLAEASASEKQYVMCHEMGHGFGLPHRDESRDNEDLGTCLDYTRFPQNNMHPDAVDFSNLADLYGTVPGSSNGGNGRRGLLRRRSREHDVFRATAFDDIIAAEAEAAIAAGHALDHYRRGRLLHSSEHGEVYERLVGEGSGRVVTRILF